MALPSSGSISAANINVELGRTSTDPLSLGGATERALAGIASGPISFDSFHGKSSKIEKDIVGSTDAVTLESLFTGAEWTSDTEKVVTIASGVDRATRTAETVVTIGSTPWGGTLTFNVNGSISGKSGDGGGGVGGNAFDANITGASGQKIVLNVTGTLRAGGGGGGDGGAGGNGSKTSSVREPESLYYYSQSDPKYYFRRCASASLGQIMWNGVVIAGGLGDTATKTVGDYTYYATNQQRSFNQTAGVVPKPVTVRDYDIFRTSTSEVTTYGGAGGRGGKARGFGQLREYGEPGSAGDTNAGTGGDGGRGGDWGAQGATGASGTNGTATAGSAGLPGGLPGYAILNSANATIINNGTLIGRIG